MAAILHELFVQTDTGVAVVDRGHCILAWNPGAERLFGWPAPEITGQDIVKLLAPEGSPVRRYLGAALRGDVVQAVPVMLRQKSGDLSQLLLTCRGVVTSQDEPPSVVLFFDPTPRRQTVESTLAHRTRELQRIIGAFPDLFFWADSSGRVLDYHAGSEVDLTLPQEQFLGHRVSESFEGEAGPRLQEAIEICLREHRTVATEYTLPAPSRPRHVEARIVPLTPDDVVAVVRAMTTQRRLEEELLQVSKLEAIGRLAGGIAHDFNNLLTVVDGCAAGLREELSGQARASGLLDELTSATKRASLLVRQLLTFSQRQPTSPHALDLNGLVRENAPMLTRLLRKSLAVSLDLAEESPWVFADPVELEQVLYNLCANARDAMPKGGQLTIRTELRPGMAALVVSDTGIGMDRSVVAHLFEPFFSTKREGGSGLGLATVHGIVRRAGGRIEVTSNVGSGTTFTILFPSSTPEAAGTPGAGALPLSAPGGTETLLLVDDDGDVRRVLARTIGSKGYQVLEAEDYDTALQVFQEHRDSVRLVISDVAMPGRNGHELAAELRRQQPSLPIVLLSGYADAGAADETTPPAGVVILQKPPVFNELLWLVRTAIDASPASSRRS